MRLLLLTDRNRPYSLAIPTPEENDVALVFHEHTPVERSPERVEDVRRVVVVSVTEYGLDALGRLRQVPERDAGEEVVGGVIMRDVVGDNAP